MPMSTTSPLMSNKHMTTNKVDRPLDQSTRLKLAFQPISLTSEPLGLCFTVISMPRYLNIFAYIETLRNRPCTLTEGSSIVFMSNNIDY